MKSKRGVGRPAKPREVARNPGLSIRLTAEERRVIDAAVARSGLTQSAWVRNALLAAARDAKRIT